MDQDFHLIEKYFRGELNEEELQLFNTKLQNDSKFEQDFRDMKLIREGAKASARMNALSILQAAEAKHTEKETTKINVSMRRLVSIAASLIIIATVSYFAISNRAGGTMTGDEVFTAYYESYPNVVLGQERDGKGIKENTLFARAYNAYDIKDYSTSADLFSQLLELEKTAANYLYSGISNLEAGNLDVAKNHFNVVMNNYAEMKEQSQWYLALTLLKEGDVEAGASNLVYLVEQRSSFERDSKKALNALGMSLFKLDNDGHVETVNLVPNNGSGQGGNPDGSFMELRQYQTGKIRNLGTQQEYPFWNDVPIYDLRPGDLVDYVVVRSKTNTKKSWAVIMDKR